MTITDDRAALVKALQATDFGIPIKVLGYVPSSPAPNICYLEMQNITAGHVFGTLEITWNITFLCAAVKQVSSTPEKVLDTIAATAIERLCGEYADLENIDSYRYIYDVTNGASYPAVVLTVKSQTRI